MNWQQTFSDSIFLLASIIRISSHIQATDPILFPQETDICLKGTRLAMRQYALCPLSAACFPLIFTVLACVSHLVSVFLLFLPRLHREKVRPCFASLCLHARNVH